MGKKKDKECTHGSDHQTRSASVEAQSQPQDSAMNTVKKPKKHKHKKSSKKEEVERIINVEDIEDVDISVDDIDDSPTQGLKLKIKLPDSSPEKPTTPKSVKVKSEKTKTSGSKKSGKKKDGKGEDDTDSEEERWLDAIESGKLEEVDDELKRMKNPRLMTARQRAMLEKEKKSDGTDDTFPVIPAEPLLSLPSGFKEKVITQEMLAKKAMKTQKRREQAQEKREEDKKKTVDRLLKKQDSKVGKISRLKFSKKEIPMYSYINNKEMATLSVPVSFPFPMEPQSERKIPVVVLCGAPGCSNPKKYSCSRTGIPLCSLQCYSVNMSVHKPFITA
ncbi:INO80 complex subunit B-like [Homarus americanus]|uniref:INO80 complex subunit B-like n=1 Tax=Homarus americanus TaxID=6706 RepID=UPI001C4729A1|nr:INO80 complex subunit B-like [Homarus americanus]